MALGLLSVIAAVAGGGGGIPEPVSEDDGAPDPAPDLRGPVVDRLIAHHDPRMVDGCRRGTITVEDQCCARLPYRREVTITLQTRMLRLEGDDLFPVEFEDVRPGERVEVWLTRNETPFAPLNAPADFVVLARQ
jgi:hypothetical protein